MDEARRNALIELGATLDGTEAGEMAGRLEAGETISQALGAVLPSRRPRIRALLTAAGYGVGRGTADDPQRMMTIAGLRGIQGAHSTVSHVLPVWTTPHLLAGTGDLNSSRGLFVKDAQVSVSCSTYNFQESSGLWKTLKQLYGDRPEVAIRLYLDGKVNDGKASCGTTSLSPERIAAELPFAAVFRTKEYKEGKRYVNHAKFLIVDHRTVLVTSANLSYSAENLNVELGLRMDAPNLAESIETEMRRLERHVYEQL